MKQNFVILLFLLLVIQAKSSYTNLYRLFGTHFCGAGSTEDHSDQLGIYPGLDNCCRYHDSCPDQILSGTENYHLFNDQRWTISSCKCDEAFRSCLKWDGSDKSLFVARMYFNSLEIPCFELKKGKICTEYDSIWWWKNCVKEETAMIAKIKPARRFTD